MTLSIMQKTALSIAAGTLTVASTATSLIALEVCTGLVSRVSRAAQEILEELEVAIEEGFAIAARPPLEAEEPVQDVLLDRVSRMTPAQFQQAFPGIMQDQEQQSEVRLELQLTEEDFERFLDRMRVQ